ncbi:MAG: S41 family peptidase, partial [Bacteroidia bacterium]|nr:S41 family peptidase [Bacteroidia bacterium]
MSNRIVYPFLAGGLIVIGMLVGYQFKENHKPKNTPPNFDKFEEVVNFVNKNYMEEVNNEKLIDDAIQGLLEGLDPHSFYIPAVEMKEVDEQMSGSFEGIGVEFNILEDTIFVVAPISGGPSEKLGILSGDRIVKINDENVAGIGITNNDVMKRLKGPKGTTVKVSIKRAGVSKLIDFTIERDKIPVYSVDYSYMVDAKTGYIKISRFAETTFREFREHLTKLKSAGMENLLLDLRGNPGGYMQMAQLIADEFLSEGKLVVYTKGRTPESHSRYEATSAVGDFEKGALVIMIDQGSASASEIVTGAVQDWDRGLVVGTRSFGKGIVQTQKKLADGSAIRLAISKYYIPSGRCIQKPYNKSAKEYSREVYERYESGELYDESKIKLPDSLKFKTKSGREVYGGGGVVPDVFVPRDTTGASEYLTNLYVNNVFRQFAVRYSEKTNLKNIYPDGKTFSDKFVVTDAILKEFKAFAAEKSVPLVEKDFKTSQKIIELQIKAFIGRTVFNNDGFYPTLHKADNTFQKAYNLIPAAKELE